MLGKNGAGKSTLDSNSHRGQRPGRRRGEHTWSPTGSAGAFTDCRSGAPRGPGRLSGTEPGPRDERRREPVSRPLSGRTACSTSPRWNGGPARFWTVLASISTRALRSATNPAQRQLAEIARVFLGEPKLVILDEPTSSLAAAQVELLFKAVRTLADDGIAIIYVSHRMEEIRQIASAATIMRDGRIADTIDVADASTRDIVRLMLGHDESQDEAIAANPRLRSAPVVLSAAGVALPPKLENVDLELRQGEVLGIAGLLGSGRTELLSVLSGLATPTSGEVCIDARRKEAATTASGCVTALASRRKAGRKTASFPNWESMKTSSAPTSTEFSKWGMLSWPRIRAAAEAIIQRMTIIAQFVGAHRQSVRRQ